MPLFFLEFSVAAAIAQHYCLAERSEEAGP